VLSTTGRGRSAQRDRSGRERSQRWNAALMPSIPAAGPSYPFGPFHFVGREYFVVIYETDAAAIRANDDPTVDLNLKYTWRPSLSIFVDYINIFNNSPDWYTINQSRINMSELYGARLNVGVSGRF